MDGMIERNEMRLTHQVAILLIPVTAGWIWCHGAATQDGPSHLAAAKIANDWIGTAGSGETAGTVRSIYRLHFEPVPNWGGQALGMALVATLPIAWAEVAMNLAGLWLPAISLAWLFEFLANPSRSGARNARMAPAEMTFLALWIATMAMNVLWTFGFTSFLLGTGLAWAFLRTLLSYGEAGGGRLWLMLAALFFMTFLCHLVAFAIAGIVSACLLAFTPKWSMPRRVSIAIAMAMALPLLIRYRMLTADNPLEPIWEHFSASEILSPANWARQFGWVDPVSLHSKSWHPLAVDTMPLAMVLQPALWVAIALIAVVAATGFAIVDKFQTGVRFVDRSRRLIGEGETGRTPDRREMPGNQPVEASLAFRLSHWRFPRCVAWSMAIVVLAILGTIGPDSLGPRQGHYLPQRFFLAALSLLPAIGILTRTEIPRSALGSIAVAWILHSVSAIDYGRRSDELTQPIRADRAAIRPGDRILALIDAEPWPYRANPRLHADALLVTAAPYAISWNLYEASHPYFPLQFRQISKGCDPATLEAFSLATNGEDPARTTESVHELLAASAGKADVVYVWMNLSSDRRDDVLQAIGKSPGWSVRRTGPASVVFRNDSPRVSE